MAFVDVQILNPTGEDLTYSGDTALANAATALNIGDSDSDLWIAAGCAILPTDWDGEKLLVAHHLNVSQATQRGDGTAGGSGSYE